MKTIQWRPFVIAAGSTMVSSATPSACFSRFAQPWRRISSQQHHPCLRLKTSANLSASFSSSDADNTTASSKKKRIAVIGGGLAGLSVTIHLLEKVASSSSSSLKQEPSLSITVLDRAASAGLGGASAVAGGLVHPLSPRGKLVHWGLEGLQETARLVQKAVAAGTRDCSHEEDDDNHSTIVLRDELYRIAVNEKQALQLQETAVQLSDLAEWLDQDQTVSRLGAGAVAADHVKGALRLHNGCQVIHVPSYLRGLWRACEHEAIGSGSTVEWRQISTNEKSSEPLEDFDVTVYCAGAGMFTHSIDDKVVLRSMQQRQRQQSPNSNGMSTAFPVQLVRGQSLELHVQSPRYDSLRRNALLCGKYVSPLPFPNKILLGATHEFQSQSLTEEQVVNELKERTSPFLPADVWSEGGIVDRVTSGVRVQSSRGWAGRRPIVGSLPSSTSKGDWIFTGLSSRGLLYHGIYGKYLAEAIFADSEQVLLDRCSDILWWRNKE